MPGTWPGQPQHPGGITAGEHRPVRQHPRPRVGAQPESRGDQVIGWSTSGQGSRSGWLPFGGSLRHEPRLCSWRSEGRLKDLDGIPDDLPQQRDEALRIWHGDISLLGDWARPARIHPDGQ